MRSSWLILTVCLCGSGCTLSTSISQYSVTPTEELEAPEKVIALDPSNFEVVYDGHGQVTIDPNGVVLAPQPSTAADETYAALVLIKETLSEPLRDFELTIDVTTNEHLRQNSLPNDWEVFWLFFSYSGSALEKTTNYFITKPNSGAELGLAHGQLGQKFLNTSASAKTPLLNRYTFKFIRLGNLLSVYRDGSLFYSYTDVTGFPDRLYNSQGAIGFYVEDARATVHSVKLRRLDKNPAATPQVPLLTASALEVLSTEQDSAVSVSTPQLPAASLFWSCGYKKLIGDLSANTHTDCLGLGDIGASGALAWVPSLNDIGSWLFTFEASEGNSGFAQKNVYVQVRSDWTPQQLFFFEPQLSLLKDIDGVQRPVTRDLASENNKTSAWPDLVSGDMLNLSGLNQAMPWSLDSDTQMATLHFDGLQSSGGLSLPVSGLGTTQDIRVSYWFKRDNADSKTAILIPHGGGVLESRHWFGVASSRYQDASNDIDCYDTTPATGDWTFMTTQVISGNLKTFVSGREICSQTLPATYNFASPFQIGPTVQTFFPFAGKISEMAGYKTSTSSEIFHDFLATADRYRKNKIGPLVQQDLVLHWDMANAEKGLVPSSTATVTSLFDLGPKELTKVFGGFNGDSTSGYITTPAATSHILFDGSDDYIELNPTSNLSLGAYWTIEAWLQPGVARGVDNNYPPSDVRHEIFKGVLETGFYDVPNKLSHGFGMRLGSYNTLDAYVINNYGFTDTVQSTLSLNSNQWYHVAVSFDKTTGALKTYINGQLNSTKTIDYHQDMSSQPQSDGDILSEPAPIYVGIPFDTDTLRRFNGRLGALRVYKKALSDSQIKMNCTSQKDRYGVICP